MESLGRRSFGSSRSNQTLEEKPEEMTDPQWMSLEKKACSVIRGCLTDAMLY